DVEAEGETTIEGFDIAAEVGSMTAVVKMFDIEVDDGTLELEFVGRKGQPVVSAIEVLRSAGDAADDGGERSR
ncbi:MAG TPA: malectin domain-containing carbohydrate-binding protein, partial [Thermomicrobiales bacterium]|nr:malectin domain-containing carbohydrate-binding protein [Thermomicrobiales bacterium]